MNVQLITPTQASLIAAHKARQARFTAAAKKVKQDPSPLPRIDFAPFQARKIPLWTVEELHFDAHVKAFDVWRSNILTATATPLKTYIFNRCEELGASFSDVLTGDRRKQVVAIRQLLMWEVKTLIKPQISFPELGRLFGGRDHTTCLHAVRRIQEAKERGER